MTGRCCAPSSGRATEQRAPPAIAHSEESREGGKTRRKLTLHGGGEVVEELERHSDGTRSYSYTILHSPFVARSSSIRSVERDDCVVVFPFLAYVHLSVAVPRIKATSRVPPISSMCRSNARIRVCEPSLGHHQARIAAQAEQAEINGEVSRTRIDRVRAASALLHDRAANPGHYDAVLQLFAQVGLEPRLQLRALSFDLVQTPVANGEAVAIVGASSLVGLAESLRWVPLSPPVEFEVSLVARRYGRSPAVDRALEVAASLAAEQGWLTPPSGAHAGAT